MTRLKLVIALVGFWALWLVAPSNAQQIQVETKNAGQKAGRSLGVYSDLVRLSTPELGTVDLRWDEIQDIRSLDPLRLNYGEDEVLRGVIIGREGATLVVQSADLGQVRLKTSSLPLAPELAAPAQKTPLTPKPWSGKVALGLTATGGNSDTFTGNLEASIERIFSHDRIEAGFRAVYGESNGEVNADAQLLRGKWEHYYSGRFYSFAGVEIGRDLVQEIEARVFVNLGAGYTVWKDSDDEFLKTEAGLGFRHESFRSDTASRKDITGRAALIYDDLFWSNLDFHQLAEVIVPLSDPASWLARSETVLSVPIYDNWSFRNSIVLTYQGRPAAGAKNLDWLVTAGLEYRF
ncbi:MAG: DUF481 domain-containing protein [Planctomycetota bacterium]